jgi:hypothetical protein
MVKIGTKRSGEYFSSIIISDEYKITKYWGFPYEVNVKQKKLLEEDKLISC